MGILQEPTDTVVKIVSLPRWQREWINSRKSVNFSGLVQEMIIEMIKQYDQEFYIENEHLVECRMINRRDVIKSIVRSHPEIVPAI